MIITCSRWNSVIYVTMSPRGGSKLARRLHGAPVGTKRSSKHSAPVAQKFFVFFWIRAIEMADNRLSDHIYGQKGVPNSDQGVVSQFEIFFS